MKPLKNLLTTVTALGALALSACGSSDTQIDCETYQGFREDNSDAVVRYNFDSKPSNIRDFPGAPEYSLVGNPDLRDVLEKGQKYCFEFTESKNPFQDSKLVRINAGENKSVINAGI